MVAACGQDEVTIRQVSDDSGRMEMMAALEKLAAEPGSAQRYGEFSAEMVRLRPRFNSEVWKEADRSLVLLALAPMEVAGALPPAAQLEALALTVWPTAFAVAPLAGESPHDYVARLCSGALAHDCKYVVPEYWPLLVGALAWRRLKERSRQVVADCDCDDEGGFASLVARYEKRDGELDKELAQLGSEVKASAWPVAGDNARPWSSPPLLERRRGGQLLLEGVEIDPAECAPKLRDLKGTSALVGVHLHPQDKVGTLRSVLADATAAGFTEAALQVRSADFPFASREYRLALDRRKAARLVKARNADTIQILVRVLDAGCADPSTQLRL